MVELTKKLRKHKLKILRSYKHKTSGFFITADVNISNFMRYAS